MRTFVARLLVAAITAAAAVGLQAAVPTFWQVATEADFMRGDAEGLALDSYGRLTLGPATSTLYDSNAPFLWVMAPGPDGGTFVGTGNEGQVLLVDSSCRGRILIPKACSTCARPRA